MERLADLLPRSLKVRSKASTQHQLEGGEAAEKLGAKTDQDFAKIIRCFKVAPGAAHRALTFVLDYPNGKRPIGIFLWRFNQIRKEAKARLQPSV